MSAKVLDNKRLGKERVECLQLLKALKTGPIQRSLTPQRGFKYNDGLYQRKTPWYNHPACKMWRGYETALYLYAYTVCNEWTSRGYVDNCKKKIQEIAIGLCGCVVKSSDSPPWIGNEAFHASHRAALLYKFPSWYSQFGWQERPDIPNENGKLNYVWPI